MPRAGFAELTDRGVATVTGADAEKLLQGLITNDMARLAAAPALYAGLLSPQGKILFDFIIVRIAGGFALDTGAERVADLVKRLHMYKLRASVDIADASGDWAVGAKWSEPDSESVAPPGAHLYFDPRTKALGTRILASRREAQSAIEMRDLAGYLRRRIELEVPNGGTDFQYGDAYPHEADFDLLNGVSFKKGCYVGQEIVSRMENKTVVRRRVVGISGDGPLSTGAEIKLGDVPIGRVGSVNSNRALAMLRLDRAMEALEKAITLTADGAAITVSPHALERYRSSLSARSGAGLPS